MTEATWTAFQNFRRIARGPLADVAVAVKDIDQHQGPVLIFDDSTGKVRDLDLRGTEAEIVARYSPEEPARGRGRPKLGVTAREVTLLPRQWDWLAAQPGGASAALRRLIDAARKDDEGRVDSRRARDATYAVMSAMAGDLPGFEEATRALYAGDSAGFAQRIADWPADLRDHLRQMIARDTAFADRGESS